MPRDFNFQSYPLADGVQEWVIFKGQRGKSWMVASSSESVIHIHLESTVLDASKNVWKAAGDGWDVRVDLVGSIELLGLSLTVNDYELLFCKHLDSAIWPRKTYSRVPKGAGTLYTFPKSTVELVPAWKDRDASQGISHFAKIPAGELGQAHLALALILEFCTYPRMIPRNYM